LNESDGWGIDCDEIEKVIENCRQDGITPKALCVINPGEFALSASSTPFRLPSCLRVDGCGAVVGAMSIGLNPGLFSLSLALFGVFVWCEWGW